MSIMIEFQAEIHSIGETEVFESGFQKRSMIVKLIGEKENEKYPTYLPIEAKKDKVIEFDQYAPGQVVDAKCFLSGNLWQPTDGRPEKAFVGLDLWEMKTAEGSSQGQAPSQDEHMNYGGQAGSGSGVPQGSGFDPSEDTGDIPFKYCDI